MTTRRDIEVSTPTTTSGAPGRKVIATIGIDRYHHWQRLANAVRDATRTAELFGRLGFEQITAPLLDHDATGKAIQSLVTSDLRKLGPDDSLVLFYAGHGATYGHRPGGEEIKAGYLIPADAASSPDDVSTWIDLEGWLRAVALLPAKHILVILDACRSGIALDGIVQRHRGDEVWRHETSAALQARRSRRIITSALGDQVALDSGPKHGHSLFTGCLIEGLTYDLRQRGDRATTGSGLGTYLQRRVDTHTKSQQTPDFGYFYHDDRGEIAIPLVGAAFEADSVDKPEPVSAELIPPPFLEPRPEPVPPPGAPRRKHSIPVLRWLTSPANPAAAVASPRHPAQPVSADSGHDRSPTLVPSNTAELSRLVERLDHAVTTELQKMTVGIGLACGVSLISFILGALNQGFFFVGGYATLVMLAIAVLRVSAPVGMRRVVQAVRDAPERVILLRHHRARALIEIRTIHGRLITINFRLILKATQDGQALFDALMRRCPTARVDRR